MCWRHEQLQYQQPGMEPGASEVSPSSRGGPGLKQALATRRMLLDAGTSWSLFSKSFPGCGALCIEQSSRQVQPERLGAAVPSQRVLSESTGLFPAGQPGALGKRGSLCGGRSDWGRE